MNLNEVFRKNPVMAIMRNIPLEKTIDYAQAVFDGGVAIYEVAMNSVHGVEQIAMLKKHFGDKALFGAGTAVTTDLAKAALDAGADFLLTPSSPAEVLAYCAKNNVGFLPGVFSPTDVGLCLSYGFSTLKLFPAGDMPFSYVKNLKGPFDTTDYVAIGGVSPDNIGDFFKAGYIGVGMGSNLFPKEYLAGNAWDKATAAIKELVARSRQALGA